MERCVNAALYYYRYAIYTIIAQPEIVWLLLYYCIALLYSTPLRYRLPPQPPIFPPIFTLGTVTSRLIILLKIWFDTKSISYYTK